jgi:hypothetical protein
MPAMCGSTIPPWLADDGTPAALPALNVSVSPRIFGCAVGVAIWSAQRLSRFAKNIGEYATVANVTNADAGEPKEQKPTYEMMAVCGNCCSSNYHRIKLGDRTPSTIACRYCGVQSRPAAWRQPQILERRRDDDHL